MEESATGRAAGYRTIGETLEALAKNGELRVRYFARNGTYGIPIGRIRAIAGSILELHLGHVETLRPGTDIAFQERSHFFTVIALLNDEAQQFSIQAENHEHAREVYARMYGVETDTVIAVVPGEIGPVAIYGGIEEWTQGEWVQGDPEDY